MSIPRRITRTFSRVVIPAIAVAVWILAAPGSASAHPTLLFTTPAVDTAEPDSPPTVVLVFSEPVTLGPDPLVVVTGDGSRIPVQQVTTERGGTTVTGHISHALPPGVYTVRWRATGADGDLAESSFRFAVGVPITAAASTDTSSGTSWPAVPLRWLLFTGFALIVGGAVGRRITDSARAVRPSLAAVRAWTLPAALAGLAGIAGLGVLLAANAGIPALLAAPGRILLAEAAAFAAAIGFASSRWRAWTWLPLLAVVPIAEGVRSHVGQAAPGWGTLVTVIHLAAAGIWVGALVHVVRAAIAWRHTTPALRWIVTGYARWAVWCFAAVVASGTIVALVLVPLPALTTTGYGRLLLVKLALVALAAAAAVAARLALRNETRLARITAATRIEAVTLTVVVAVTAALVSTPTARDTVPLTPPPANGTVLPLATLAGQVGVTVAVSEGQIVVRLSAPNAGDYYQTNAVQQHFGLAVRVLAAAPADLRLRGCGPGCYSAPVTWHTGDNVITLAVTADGWTGGTVSLLAPWPVTPAPDQLARVTTVLRNAGPVTVYEQVTSDTSTGTGEVVAIRISGADFLATEPYNAGLAPQVVQTATGPATTSLALGFPADGRYVQMTVDDQNRIISETVVDAKHIIRRSFVYPEAEQP